tara:strand:+ start:360 stop:617 length:258 start_codon:yes stop_codon:yes gene_type:complete
MDTEIKEAEQKEQFNVTFVFRTAVIGVGVIMPEGTGEQLLAENADGESQLGNSMVLAGAEELLNSYGFDVNAHDLQDVMIEDVSY